MNKIIVIVHDNGKKGAEGATEYTISELYAEGGLCALLGKYRSHGVYVYRWFETYV